MSSNLREFTLALGAFAERDVPERVVRAHKVLALEGMRGVVDMTPVDTGRLRGNWQMTHDEPPTAFDDALTFNGNEGAAAQYALERARSVVDGIRFGEVTWIGNGIDYAVFVNDGTPKMAGHHMVEVTAARLQAIASRL